jgi:hypothetical protein
MTACSHLLIPVSGRSTCDFAKDDRLRIRCEAAGFICSEVLGSHHARCGQETTVPKRRENSMAFSYLEARGEDSANARLNSNPYAPKK